MLRTLKQARAALSLLNPEEVRRRADRPVHIGLVAASDAGYAEMEDFLAPQGMQPAARKLVLDRVHRASDKRPRGQVDLVLYQRGLRPPEGAFTFDDHTPEHTIADILAHDEELGLPLARQYPGFRWMVIQRIVHSVARENALFAVATALPDVVPSLIELPWAFGEFASDTAFLTANQVRMAFLIGAACGREIGFAHQKAAVLAIVGGAFGWRALARELAGHIPFGGGLIVKGAISYAGTFVVGKALERLCYSETPLTREERETAYRDGYRQGAEVAGSWRAQP